jgi:hypothetical protein
MDAVDDAVGRHDNRAPAGDVHDGGVVTQSERPNSVSDHGSDTL